MMEESGKKLIRTNANFRDFDGSFMGLWELMNLYKKPLEESNITSENVWDIYYLQKEFKFNGETIRSDIVPKYFGRSVNYKDGKTEQTDAFQSLQEKYNNIHDTLTRRVKTKFQRLIKITPEEHKLIKSIVDKKYLEV